MNRIVEVKQIISVDIDESKFDEEFMEDFRQNYITSFTKIEDHVAYLTQLYAKRLADNYHFIEGYGKPEDMGIHFEELSCDVEVLKED